MKFDSPLEAGWRTRFKSWNRVSVAWAALFLGAVFTRVLLCWANPPWNSFDDHYTPIFMIIESGALPAKDACFQCYHPPVFYLISAAIGEGAILAGATTQQVLKLLQFAGCVYGILTVALCYLILKKLPLSNFARLVSFGTGCFLPRHIYMSAMNSNDTISYLFVALSIYSAMVAFERGFSPWTVAGLSLSLTIAVFTKYTAFAALPAVCGGFVLAFRTGWSGPKKRVATALAATFALPLLCLGGYLGSNWARYQSALPWNVGMYDPSADRPRDKEAISFLTFKPWEEARTPILAPGKLHSFWTLIYSGMWFDTEPYFICYEGSPDWWSRYGRWYTGKGSYPGANPDFPRDTAVMAAGMILLGLVPLAFMAVGAWHCVSGKWRVLMAARPGLASSLILFPILFAFNAAGIIALTVRLPVYNSMKASYFLISTPAFVVFLSLGLAWCERSKPARRAVLIVFCALFAISALHILRLAPTLPQ